ncbi:MAG TPA: tetratricopeptide repeat protein [Vicinamibacteria bacterium]|nr:tetratricopeptide repeat protein [Vicinamibacteria bacterium]
MILHHIIELEPGSPAANLLLGDAYYRIGELARAEAIWREEYSRSPETHERDMFEIALALIATERGGVEEGRRVLEKYRGTPYRDLTHLTEIAALLGDVAYVVDRVESHPGRNYRWLIEEPKLEALAGRATPRRRSTLSS